MRKFDNNEDIIQLDDQLISGDLREELEKSVSHRRKRAAITNFSNHPLSKWTFPIRYFLDSKYTEEEKNVIRKAFEHWETQTCITFQEESSKAAAQVDVRKSSTATECLSFIGKDKIDTSPQILFLGSSCLNPIGLTLHEIGHLLGLWHEHQRADRQNYVNILLNNAKEEEQSNFIAVSETLVESRSTPYDYGSVMHYKGNAFSRQSTSLNTIEAKDSLYQRSMGQRVELSYFDVKSINLAYCSETCSTQTKLTCSHEGYQNPKDCSSCLCPPGLSGKFCEKSSSEEDGCGFNLHLMDDQTRMIESPGYTSNKFYPLNSKCAWNITTDPGYIINMKFNDEFGIACSENHCQDYLEMRLNGDYGKPGPRFCCKSPQSKEVKSDFNSVLLVFRSIRKDTQDSDRRGFEITLQRVFDETCASRCRNGGACTGEPDQPCLCKPGFSGKFCEEDIDDCKPNPCLNNGVCSDEVNGYSCRCVNNYSGKRCEIEPVQPNGCEPNPCKNNGLCISLTNTEEFFCSCREGYSGKTCEIEPACLSSPCKNNGICLDLVGGKFFCNCLNGYEGTTCEKKDPCIDNTCNKGECIKDNDKARGYRCLCEKGYYGEDCNTPDACVSKPCGDRGVCVITENPSGFKCQCYSGYTGEFCENTNGPCSNKPCGENGYCLSQGTSFTCQCFPGFTGSRCERNPCYNNPCKNNGVCTLDSRQTNGFRCECTKSFTGLNCEIDSCSSNPCYGSGECSLDSSKEEGYVCLCEKGYTGKACEISPCANNPCSFYGSCVIDSSKPSGFKCNCRGKYTGDRCEIEKTCPSNYCKNGGSCLVQSDGTFICICHHNYFGDTCSFESKCKQSPCQNGGTCRNHGNFRTCFCPPGFQGFSCERKESPCSSNPCFFGGTCILKGTDFICVCPSHRTGKSCEIEIDHCQSSPCVRGYCVRAGGSYNCTCWDGFTGKNCDKPPSICRSNPCKNGGTCRESEVLRVDGQVAAECDCAEGYSGRFCENIDDKSQSCSNFECLNEGICVQINEEPTCVCKKGYGGDHCEKEVEETECESNPCRNNGLCYVEGGVPKCQCSLGWGGDRCTVPCGGCPAPGRKIYAGSLYKPCMAKKLESDSMIAYSGRYGYGGYHKCWWNWWNKPKPREEASDFTCCEGAKLIKTKSGNFKCAVEGWGEWDSCPSCGSCQKSTKSLYQVHKCDRNYYKNSCNYRRDSSVSYMTVVSCETRSCNEKPCSCSYPHNYYCSKCKYGCRYNKYKNKCTPSNIAGGWYAGK